MPKGSPALSVILIIADQRERARLSLQSLLRQSLIDHMEVMLFDRGKPGTAPLPESNHDRVRQIRVEQGVDAGWLRAEGVRQARAPLVAFLEEHCLAFPNWAEAILKAFEGPWAGVGPEIYNGNSEAGINRFLGILNYPLYLVPAIAVPNMIPHHNAAYRREVLLGYGNRLDELLFPEDWLHLQMIADGQRLLLDPNVKILHLFETGFKASFRFNMMAGRSFEAACNMFYRRSLMARVSRCCVLLMSILMRPLRQLVFVCRNRRGWLGTFVRGFPVITSLHAAHAIGGIVGVVGGMGRDLSIRFLEAQINMWRALPDDRMMELVN